MRTQRIVKQFEDATRNHEMKGTYHPEEWDEIEEDFKRAKKKLVAHIEELKQALAASMPI